MVYFIQGEATKLIKVGKGNDIVHRLRALQAGSPDRLTVLKIIPDALEDGSYHMKFASSWSHGEWFQATPDLMDFIHLLPTSFYDGLCIRIRNRQVGSTAHPTSDATW